MQIKEDIKCALKVLAAARKRDAQARKNASRMAGSHWRPRQVKAAKAAEAAAGPNAADELWTTLDHTVRSHPG